MKIKAKKTPVFKEGQGLADFVLENVGKLEEESVVVVTSKIVALSQGRTVLAEGVDKDDLVKKESKIAVRGRYALLAFKDGMVAASAGIDQSNGDGRYVLLPKNPYQVAEELQKFLRKKCGVKKLGVVITDSRMIPLRAGAVGMAIGYAGFKGLKIYTRRKDIFGRVFQHSRVDVADSLAAAAVLAMGEGEEQTPIAVVSGSPIEFTNTSRKGEIVIKPKDDVYIPFLSKLLKRRIK